MKQPLTKWDTGYYYPDDSITLELVAAGVALACILAGIAWLVLAAFR